METESEYIYQYIPETIIRFWSADGKNVDYIEQGNDEVFSTPVDDAFCTRLFPDIPSDELESTDVFREKSLLDLISSLSNEEKVERRNVIYWVSTLLVTQFYTNPFSFGRFSDIVRSVINDPENEKKSIEAKYSMVQEKIEEKMSASSLLSLRRNAVFASPYLFDLDFVLLETDKENPFILSGCPLLLFNPLFPKSTINLDTPFHTVGMVLLMPISPVKAFCLYDRNSYKIKKTDGKALLSSQDVSDINRVMYRNGPYCLVARTSTMDRDWAVNERYFINPYLTPPMISPSVFLLRARCLDLEKESIRDYVRQLSLYDTRYFSREIEKTRSREVLEKRIDYCISLLSR